MQLYTWGGFASYTSGDVKQLLAKATSFKAFHPAYEGYI